jgi:hypothetical protein
VSTTNEPEKTNLLAGIVSNYLVPIIGGVLLALQGFNMHNTGEVARESGEIQQATKLEIQETSQELKEIRELHQQQVVILSELAKNDTTAKSILAQIVAALDEIKKVNAESDASIDQRQKEILDEIKELNKLDPTPSPSPPS